MKEGWVYKKLGEVANFFSGYTPNKEDISNQGEYPYFKVAEMNIEGNELFMKNTSLFVNSPKKIFPKGSIIFPKNGGAIYTEKKRILEVDSVIDLNTEAIFPTAQVELMYLYFLLTFIKISRFDKGGGLPSLDLKKMSDFIVPVPPLSEQQSIVAYLDSAFAKIDSMKANAEKALNEAKALFQASLKEMLEPKEGWEVRKFGDLVESNVVGLTRGKIDQGYDKKYPYFKMNNISHDNTLCWDDIICVDANEEELNKYCLQEGDFLFNTRNSKEWVGKSTVYRQFSAPVMLYNNNIMRIRFVDSINPVFIAYSFLADFTKMQLEKIKSGTTNVWAIYYKDLSKILISHPTPIEQKTVVDSLDSIKSKLDQLQANFDKISQECDALKQAILRQVFES